GRQVAVADERLTGLPDFVDVQQRNDLGASISAADADDAMDRGVRQRGPDGSRPYGRRARDVAGRRAGEDRIVGHGFESQPPDLVDTGVKFLSFERAGRRHHGKAAARRHGTRLLHQTRSSLEWTPLAMPNLQTIRIIIRTPTDNSSEDRAQRN